MLTIKRANEVKNVFLNDIEQSRTIPGRLVQPFWEFYSGEFRPGKYASMPCTCNPKTWIQMVQEVTDEVNQVLELAATQVNIEEPTEEPVKKKRKGVAVDKTSE